MAHTAMSSVVVQSTSVRLPSAAAIEAQFSDVPPFSIMMACRTLVSEESLYTQVPSLSMSFMSSQYGRFALVVLTVPK